MGQVRIADLVTTENIDKDSFVIIEKPGIGDGTYKSTVSKLQEVITVIANITKVDRKVTIYIKDINGETEESLITPTAKIRDNGDNSVTITLVDTDGTTEETLYKDGRIVDDEPTEGSHNFVTSGVIYEIQKAMNEHFKQNDDSISDLYDRTELLESAVRVYYNVGLVSEVRDPILTEDGEEIIIPLLDTIQTMRMEGGVPFDPNAEDLIISTFLQDNDGHIYTTEDGVELMVPVSDKDVDFNPETDYAARPYSTTLGSYHTFVDARVSASLAGGIMRFRSSISDETIVLNGGINITVDLNGYTWSLVGGLDGLSTIGIYVHPDAKLTIQNGILKVVDSRLSVGIQNYGDIVLDNVEVFAGVDEPNLQTVGTFISTYAGTVTLAGTTTINTTPGWKAIDCCYGEDPEYYFGNHVIVDGEAAEINGVIDFRKAIGPSVELFAEHASIRCLKSKQLNIAAYTPPCDWVDFGEEKIFKYILDPDNNSEPEPELTPPSITYPEDGTTGE